MSPSTSSPGEVEIDTAGTQWAVYVFVGPRFRAESELQSTSWRALVWLEVRTLQTGTFPATEALQEARRSPFMVSRRRRFLLLGVPP